MWFKNIFAFTPQAFTYVMKLGKWKTILQVLEFSAVKEEHKRDKDIIVLNHCSLVASDGKFDGI
jgi:hypothetical protein